MHNLVMSCGLRLPQRKPNCTRLCKEHFQVSSLSGVNVMFEALPTTYHGLGQLLAEL